MKFSKWLVALLGALGFVSLLPSIGWADGIGVQVGYADNLRSNPFFPSNFCNGNTQFDGSSGATCSQVFDSGAIRIINNTGQTMNVTDVLVTVGSATFDLWNTSGAFHDSGRHGRSSGSDTWRKFRHERFWKCVCARQFSTADNQAYVFSWHRRVTVDDLHRFRTSLEYRGI